jgi:hypothetical protein
MVRLFVGIPVAGLAVAAVLVVGFVILVPPCHFPPSNPARTVRLAAMQWLASTGPEHSCPSVSELVRAGNLAPDSEENLVDSQFRITCLDADVAVTSAGLDRRFGTVDDTSAP